MNPRDCAGALLAALAALSGLPSSATAADWVAVPECSSLSFFATQQGARFEGRFERFEAQVTTADDGRPVEVLATIELESVSTGDEERDLTVVDVDFFNTTLYPRSMFRTDLIDARGDGYRAIADLSLRDRSRPVAFDFDWRPPLENDTRARLTGQSDLKRLEFGVGQGDWQDTEWIGDEVEVRVDVCLERRAGS